MQNVETLAHVALIARYGAQWFRSLGSSDSPGTMLLSVTGRWSETVVVEAAYTTPMREILGLTPSEIAQFQGANLGGYGGSWVSMKTLMSLTLSESVARDANATLGAGIVILLPRDVCPVSEVARVAHYMRDEGAGQCGPCVNGLAEIADLLGGIVNVAAQRRKPAQVRNLLELCNLVEGRGACRHPDGVARFVRSAISVFDSHFDAHFHSSPCAQAGSYGVLPLPAPNHRRMVSTSRGAK